MKRSIYWVTAGATGIVVANNYYNQPLLANFALAFQTSERQAGAVSVAAQTGYAVGLLLFVPLGDKLERRAMLRTLLCIASLALAAVALSPTLNWLVIASFVTGVASVGPQLLTPFAAELAGPQQRGEAVGIVMFGLLCRILVSRSISGSIAENLGWRTVYWLAAAAMLVTAAVLTRVLPHAQATYAGTYRSLMRSLWTLLRDESLVRQTSAIAALQFAAFSAFWTTLAFYLRSIDPRYGSESAGLFGLVGVAGAVASTCAGRFIDTRNPRQSRIGKRCSFRRCLCGACDHGHTIAGLIGGVILLDIGLQSGHVASMARNMSIRSGAMSRVNTLYMMVRFAGGAVGSSLGVWAWSLWGWTGVCAIALVLGCGSLFLQFGPQLTVESARQRRRRVE